MKSLDEPGRDAAGAEKDLVGRLLDLAGPPPPAPADLLADVKRSARVVWLEKVRSHAERRRRRLRTTWPLAAAASLVLAAGLALLGDRLGTGAPPVATVELLAGTARLDAAGAPPLAVGAAVPTGAAIATGDARLALRLAGRASVRLDRGTRLELRSATVLALLQGAVYVDAGPGAAAVALETPYGVARDVGTQFEIRLLESGLRLQVREGEVRLERQDAVHSATAGTVLTVAADGTVERGTVERHGAAWDWTLGVSPGFELEGRTVADFVAWAAREAGWQVRYADPALRAEIAASTAHGSIAAVPPVEALELVLPTSGLAFRLEGGTLYLERAGSRP